MSARTSGKGSSKSNTARSDTRTQKSSEPQIIESATKKDEWKGDVRRSRSHSNSPKRPGAVYVLAESSGRIDQTLSNISALYQTSSLGLPPVYIIDSQQVLCVLDEGSHVIAANGRGRGEGSWCSLIPLSGPATVTASGLKWNMDSMKLRFGEFISSSNTYDGFSANVTVSTDSPLLWSMGWINEMD